MNIDHISSLVHALGNFLTEVVKAILWGVYATILSFCITLALRLGWLTAPSLKSEKQKRS